MRSPWALRGELQKHYHKRVNVNRALNVRVNILIIYVNSCPQCRCCFKSQMALKFLNRLARLVRSIPDIHTQQPRKGTGGQLGLARISRRVLDDNPFPYRIEIHGWYNLHRTRRCPLSAYRPGSGSSPSNPSSSSSSPVKAVSGTA